LVEISEVDWAYTIDTYLKSVFLCMKAELRIMIEVGRGVIVNNSSVDGQRAFPWDPVYSAAKHGVLGLTKSTAVQVADRGVRVNAVCPGWIRTPPIDGILAEHPELEQRWLTHQPIGRLGRAEEVAAAVVWLCSDGASLVTGTALAVDGGYLAV
jgi:NAD(P)-dependent dehydrogenase (short-subunit alcohol dehydrogenase family)